MALQTITGNENGTQFVEKLNSNFDECMTGANGTLTLKMYGGQFKTTDGLPEWASGLSATDAFIKYYHSRLIRIGSNTTVASATLDTGETMTVLGYDESFSFVGYSTTLTIPSGSVYIRLMLYKSAGYSATRTLICTFASHAEEIKDSHVKETMYKFFFEAPITPDIPSPTTNLGNYTGVNGERHYDCGWVYLPTNYDPEGDPVPLIIYCHGTSGFNWGNPAMDFDEFHQFCSYNGYAIADCCGITDKYVIGTDRDEDFVSGSERGFCNPQLMQCINSLYEYLSEKYNFRTDGVYLIGRSTGGKTAFLLPYKASFHVKAVAGLAPGISIGTSLKFALVDEINYVLRRYGLTRHVSGSLSGSGDVQHVVDNIDHLLGWDAFWHATDVDFAAAMAVQLAHNRTDTNWSDMNTLVGQTKKFTNFPSKIWYSEDDVNVYPRDMKWYKQMVDNGNGLCILRTLPNGAGAHKSMDADTNAVRCSYVTKYKGTKSITVGYAETVDWFNQW